MGHDGRSLTFADAILEATDQALAKHPDSFLIGEGVPDPKNIFGTTKGLSEKFGSRRVFDMPISENGVTGICIGASLVGMRPILVHQRIDFSLYSADQIVNNAAKWFSMFGGQKTVPFTIRAIIGRGWGQGNQHSQNLSLLYAYIPGLKVVMPSTAYTAKGLFLAAVADSNPVIFIEHRWCHYTSSQVPEEPYTIELGKSRIAREGTEITIVAWSYMFLEAMKASDFLNRQGISVEVIDVMTIRPMDMETVKSSVKKTGRLLVLEEAWRFGGLAGEVIATVCEDDSIHLKSRARRLTNPDFPCPSTHGLAKNYYVNVAQIVRAVAESIGKNVDMTEVDTYEAKKVTDIPDQAFKGPF